MIIDGRAIAVDILLEVRKHLTRPVVVRAITVAPTPETLSYVRIKQRAADAAGMTLEVVRLSDTATVKEVVDAIHAIGADAVIVQLPLPAHLDEDYILAQIPAGKDADMLSPDTQETADLLPPVAGAVREILLHAGVDPKGKKSVVIGEGKLVGVPVATWLKDAGAEVLTLNEETFDIPLSQAALRAAGIIVSGAGVPHLIKPDMIKKGVVLVDAGTSEQGGAILGDIDPACEPSASVFTPVPGGVGPVTVACLFRNVLTLIV